MSKPSKSTKQTARGSRKRVFAAVLAGILALLLLVPYLVEIVGLADSSEEILAQIGALQQNARDLDEQQAQLQNDITETQSEAMDYVAQKAVIDQTIQVLQSRITNTQEQILEYNLLISARQEELDEARARESEMYEQYQDRIRAMEEYGRGGYRQKGKTMDEIERPEEVGEVVTPMEETEEAAAAEQPGQSREENRRFQAALARTF